MINYGYGQAMGQPQFYGTPQTQQQLPVQGIKGRPVSSLEEVRAAQVDFDGSLFVFPDVANKRIYTKQINIDGTASLNMYALTPLPTTTAPAEAANYITRQEFEEAITQLKESMTKSTVAQEPARESKPAPALNF